MVPARPPRRLDFLTVRETPDGRQLDLADLRWLDPLHLVGLATHALLAQRAGSRLLLTGLPENQAYYAARMHLGRIIELFGGQHDLPEVNERDLHDSLLEIHPLRNPQDVERLTELVYHRVAVHNETAARALHLAIGEVSSNVCQHAQSIGFMAAQTIAEHGVLRFAVADAGVGLRATLASIGAADDQQAVELALSGERHRWDPGRGYGLPGTVRIITELDGELLLASGLAATRVSPGRSMERRLDVAFSGTIFEGAVPARSPVGRRRRLAGHQPLREVKGRQSRKEGGRSPSGAVPAAPEVKQ
jgi:anti-sigma regulatory factor (Ser/Thr protein kinase)